MKKYLLNHPFLLHLGLLIFLTAYIVVGALIFYQIEHIDSETNSRLTYSAPALTERRKKCLEKMLFLVKFGAIQDRRAMTSISYCFQRPIIIYQSQPWSFQSSLLFSYSVVTTIGFAQVYPETFLGKSFFILYASIGIPLTLFFVGSSAKYLIDIGKPLVDKFRRSVHECLSDPANLTETSFEIKSLTIFLLPFLLTILVGALLLKLFQDLAFIDALYFLFGTFTTVGPGGFYPKHDYFMYPMLVFITIGMITTATFAFILSKWIRKLHKRKIETISDTVIESNGRKLTVGDLLSGFSARNRISKLEDKQIDDLIEEVVQIKNAEKANGEMPRTDYKLSREGSRRSHSGVIDSEEITKDLTDPTEVVAPGVMFINDLEPGPSDPMIMGRLPDFQNSPSISREGSRNRSGRKNYFGRASMKKQNVLQSDQV